MAAFRKELKVASLITRLYSIMGPRNWTQQGTRKYKLTLHLFVNLWVCNK